MRMTSGLIAILTLTAGIILIYSGHERATKSPSIKTVTVTTASLNIPQYYSGTIKVIKRSSVISLVDGIISGIHFVYGRSVNKNALLFTITSEKFYEGYKTALMQYIRTKSDFISKKKSA